MGGNPGSQLAWPQRCRGQSRLEELAARYRGGGHTDAMVLDPFCTGTTVMAARALGRVGIGVDLRFDYCRAARWRSFDPAPAAKTQARTWAQRQTSLTDHEVPAR